MELSEDQMQELVNVLIKTVKDNQHTFWIDPELHSNQHEFIAEFIAQRKAKEERIKKVQDYIAGSLILSTTLSFVAFLGYSINEYIRHIK